MTSMDQFAVDPRRLIAMAMLKQGIDTSPIRSWTQGAARLANALVGSMYADQDRRDQQAATQQLGALLGGNASVPDVAPMGNKVAQALSQPETVTPPVIPVEGGGTIPTPPPRPIMDRNQFTAEANDPQMAQRLATIVQGEVGRGATPEQKMIQLETAMNRAAARGQSLADVTQMYTGPGSKGYYPQSTFTGGSATPAEVAAFKQNILTPVLRGSDASTAALGFPATGNASGTVAANGIANGRYSQYGNVGPETYVQQPGGIEDISRLNATRLAGPPPSPDTLPVGAQPTQYAAQPSAAQGYGQPPVPAAQPDIKAQVQRMLASPNPYIQKQGQALASQIIQKQMLQTRPLTDPATRAQYGIDPNDTNGYQIDATGKVSPINPKPFSVNIDQKQEGAFGSTYGQEQAKRANDVVAAGDKASLTYQRNQVLKALNNQIQTGKITPATSTIGAWAQSVGIDPKSLGIDPNMPTNAQTFNALSNESMMTKLGPGGFPSQNFSDTDRKFLEKTVTNLGDTPQANELKLAISDRISQLQMAKADKWQEISTSVPASERSNAYEKFERDWRKQMKATNVFGDLISQIGSQPPSQPAAAAQRPDPLGIR